MKSVYSLLFAAALAYAQTAVFPGAVAGDSQLRVAANQFSPPTLTLPILSTDTAATVSNAAGIVANTVVTLDNEHVAVCNVVGSVLSFGKASCPNVDGRGFDSTAAAAHAAQATVYLNIDAWHHNSLKEEIKAIETALGINLANITALIPNPTPVNKGGTNAATAAGARANLSAAVLGANNDITSLSALSTPLSVPQGGTGAATLTGILEGHGTSAATANAAASELQYLRRKPNNGATAAYEFAGLPIMDAADYNFPAQSPGSPASLSAGSVAITLAPCPLGVNGTDTSGQHYLLVAGTGTAEAAAITGGTCTAGAASGTVIMTIVNAHSAGYTVASATSGISEAIWAMTSAVGGKVRLGAGTFVIYAPIKRRLLTAILVEGQGMTATILNVASLTNQGVNFPLTANGVFDWSPGDTDAFPVGGARDMTIQFYQPDSTAIAGYTHWPPAVYTNGTNHTLWEHLTILRAWDGFLMPGNTNGMQAYDIYASFFHRLFDLNGHSFDTVRLENIHASTLGLTANQGTCFLDATKTNVGFYIGSIDDLQIVNSTIGSPFVADFHAGSDGFYAGGFVSNLWGEGNITMSNGAMSFVNLHLSGGGTLQNFITYTGGSLMIDQADMSYSGTQTVISASAAHAASSAPYWPAPMFSLTNSLIGYAGTDLRGIFCTTTVATTFHCRVQNNLFSRTAGGAYVNQTILGLTGTGTTVLTVTGNRFTDVGGGSGIAIQVDTDSKHLISSNDGGGYTYSLPATRANLQFFGNNDFSANLHYLHDGAKIAATVSMSTLVPLVGPNYIASETGANNAIAGALTDAAGTNVPVADGLCVTIQLAHTLQAGANTFALNAGTARSIKRHTNAATDLGTAYAATGRPTVCYNTTGPVWLDMSQ